jgi:hypothetical protein
MGARWRMTHRALVQRNDAATDDYGQPGAASWADHATIACYLYQRPSTGEVQGERNIIQYTWLMLVPLDSDVIESNRINGVTKKSGESLYEGIFNIVQIVRRPSHWLLVLEEIKAPDDQV